MFGLFKKASAPPVPSTPISFGWKTGWFAFQTTPQSVIEKLATKAEPVDWETAIERLKSRKPFLTPAYDGWTILSECSESIAADLSALTSALGCEVAYFESHRGVGGAAYGWTKSREVVRVHSQADGQLYADIGELSDEEKSLGIQPIDFEDETEYSQAEEDVLWGANPDEESVLALAALVSIDPSTLDTFEPSLPTALKLRKWR